MKMRINFFGGPGSGKSTQAAWLFSELKTCQVSVEQVGEYVKAYAYRKQKINPYDQFYITGKQMQYEYRFLANGVDVIVTDSPLLLGPIYAKLYYPQVKIYNALENIIKQYEKEYPPINIFLNRNDKPYVEEGRYQNKNGATNLDKIIKNKLKQFYKKDLYFIDWDDKQEIFRIVWEKLVKLGFKTNKEKKDE